MTKKPSTNQTKPELLEIAKQLYDENIKLQKQYSKLEQENTSLKNSIQEKGDATTPPVRKSGISTESPRNIDDIIRILQDLRSKFGAVNSDLSTKLIARATELKAVQTSVSQEKKILQSVYDLNLDETDLNSLISEHLKNSENFNTEFKQKKELAEKKLNELRKNWQKELVAFETTKREMNEAYTKAVEREQKEYQYQIDLKQKQDKLAYEETCQQQQRELENELETQQNEWNAKENEIAVLEKEYAEFGEKADNLEKNYKNTVAKVIAETTERVRGETQIAISLRAKEIDGEKRLFEERIAAIEKVIEAQNKQRKELSDQLNAVLRQAQNLAIKAIEGASHLNSLAAVKEIALEQAQSKGQTKQ